MKKNNFLLPILFVFLIFSCQEEPEQKTESTKLPEKTKDSAVAISPSTTRDTFNWNTGDIIFQTSLGHQSDLVSMATQSPFSHCGIVIAKKNGSILVLEANGEVRQTPIQDWITSGKDSKYVVMRLKNPELVSGDILGKSGKYIKSLMGKEYDSYFLWNDNQFYCSELVWKVFQYSLNIELCIPKKLKDYELDDVSVKEELEKRYGDKIPYEEPMVAPADIAASDFLEMIYSNY